MASMLVLLLLLFFFLLFTLEEATHTTTENNIPLGSLLYPKGKNSSWPSSSGHFAFGFYPKGSGFAVGIWLVGPSDNITTVVWTANRDAPAVSSKSMLNLTEQGLLLLQNGMGDPPLYIIDLRGYGSVSSASMHDSGNFVLHDEDYGPLYVVWQSFDHPTDTILGGQNLTKDDYLVSSMSKSDHSSGRFYLGMQNDGNLVAYPFYSFRSDEDAYWDSNSNTLYGYQYQKLSLSIQGSLCLTSESKSCEDKYTPASLSSCRLPTYSSVTKVCFNNSNEPRKKSHNNTTSIYRATLDVDGNLRLYEHQFHFEKGNNSSRVVMLWQALNDTCLVKGLCGLNSYCSSNMNGDAACKCYPGFIPFPSKTKSNPNMPMDCVQMLSKDDCEKSEDRTLLYNFTHFKNMYWGDIPYSVIHVLEMETCVEACQQDCVCVGAVYTNGSCNKYRLPLIYGRVQNDSSTVFVALLKIPSSTIAIISPPTSNDTNLPKPKVVVDTKRNLIMILSLTLGSVSLICLVFAVSIFFTYRRQVNRYTMLSESEKLEFTEECSLRSFSFDELVKSTGGFSEEIGRGSFGAVYKGKIGDNNRSIAVKRLEERIADEGERETRLSWKERTKIALDVAKGLLYLHEECEVRIIHCNINPRNILMDEAWTAKISDFGFARLLKRGHSRTKIGDDGTSRYLAPEWQTEDASVSVKADIYSFGVVLLEIIFRRRSIEMYNISSAEEIILSNWVYQCFAAGQLNKLIKQDEKDVDWKILERMVKVGLWCVQDQQSLRPTMKNVILMLEGLKDIPVPPPPTRLLE